jgi:hypothetical protein
LFLSQQRDGSVELRVVGRWRERRMTLSTFRQALAHEINITSQGVYSARISSWQPQTICTLIQLIKPRNDGFGTSS